MAKVIIIVAVITTFVKVIYAFPESHLNLTEDTHNIYQCPDPTSLEVAPLCELDIQKSAKFLSVITETVDCPESGVNKKLIGCVIVKDRVSNDNGGYATITQGGLDQNSVEIYLKSQLGKGFDFHIEVYNKAEETTTTSTTTTTTTTPLLPY